VHEFAKQSGPVRGMNPIGGILPVLALLTDPRTCRTAYVSVGGRGSGQIRTFWKAAISAN
jgi:hypothetical protein